MNWNLKNILGIKNRIQAHPLSHTILTYLETLKIKPNFSMALQFDYILLRIYAQSFAQNKKVSGFFSAA